MLKTQEHLLYPKALVESLRNIPMDKIKEKAQPINEINVSEGTNTNDLNFKSESLKEGAQGHY